jgi:hypothetical protein
MRRLDIGLSVALAALTGEERRGIEAAWRYAVGNARAWKPAFAAFGVTPLSAALPAPDILVYLGESSRFDAVAGTLARQVPVVFVKSTVEELLNRAPGAPPRYRMSTGVNGIAAALAAAAPRAPTVDWTSLPWPRDCASFLHLETAEARYVDTSVAAFREAAAARGMPWRTAPPGGRPFSVFLTMHDPAAVTLATEASRRWPRCTVLAADGMVSTRTASGGSWPPQVVRVRHWSPRLRSRSNRVFRAAHGVTLPDYDSAGMLFGALLFLDSALQAGTPPDRLEDGGRHPGPLGPMRMTPSGRPQPERLVLFQGARARTVDV